MSSIEGEVSLQMNQSTPKYHWSPSFRVKQCDLMGIYGICGTYQLLALFPLTKFTRMAVFRLDTIVYAFSNIIGNDRH